MVREGKTSALPSAFLKLGTIMKPSGLFRRELQYGTTVQHNNLRMKHTALPVAV